MWKIIGSLLGGPITAISKDLKDAYQSKLNAQNDKERIAADERIAVLEARKTSILAAQSDPVERWVRIGFALPFIGYLNKVVLWDKVIMGDWSGVTDPLSSELHYIFMVILAGYFVDVGIRRIFK